jgi:hypothetical protein
MLGILAHLILRMVLSVRFTPQKRKIGRPLRPDGGLDKKVSSCCSGAILPDHAAVSVVFDVAIRPQTALAQRTGNSRTA